MNNLAGFFFPIIIIYIFWETLDIPIYPYREIFWNYLAARIEVGGAAVGDLLAGGCLNIIVVQVMYTSVLSPADTGDDLLTGGCPNVDIV